MANPEHLQILQQGVEAWNAWRHDGDGNTYSKGVRPDLTGASLAGKNFTGLYLAEVDFIGANLVHADFSHTVIAGANFSGADLREAFLLMAYGPRVNFSGATLAGAHLTTADLEVADLTMAILTKGNLTGTILLGANLSEADLSEVILSETFFSNTNLTNVRGLETCRHRSPSTLDHRTLAKSGPLPLVFLRGCGLPEALIDYLPSLLNEPVQFYSCFISYASKDQAFAERLHADLQNKGVRCWFAPEDMKIGDRLRPRIDETIRVYDKLLLVLSQTSVASQWVEQEVETALARERRQGTTILFPIRIDDTVMALETGWPALVRNSRNIGDFRRWKTHDVYQKAFARLLRDLTAEAPKPGEGASQH